MRSNNLLTFLLYALLLGLVVVGGYKACEMRKEKADLAKQDAEMKKYWSDMGSPAADSSASGGSTYASGDTSLDRTSNAAKQPSAADANGIERDDQPTPTAATKPAAPSAQAAPKTSATAAAAPTTKTETAPTTAKPAAPKPASTAKGAGAVGLGSGRYSVRVGSFSSMENARSQLEKVIKMGYPNAAIGKTNGGKFATVVVFKSNNKAAAIRVMDKLEAQGVDALVHDGN
jgi:cell division septation protein DedD